MELWVLITICAALFQTVRTAQQKHLKINLSTNGVTFVRFFYGLPWAVAYAAVLLHFTGQQVPGTSLKFLALCITAGGAQIIATSLLVYLFSFKNFVTGTTYVRTEAIQTAVFGILFFDEAISFSGFIAIAIGISGIMLISVVQSRINPGSLITGITSREALIGLGSGGFFAIASLCLREASMSLDSQNFLVRAAVTLVSTLLIQTALMGIYLWLRERDQWPELLKQWRKTAPVGLTSVLGSGCWFTAFTLTTAAYVKTVGQIEIIFTILVSHLVFREKVQMREYAGMGLIVLSVIVLINS